MIEGTSRIQTHTVTSREFLDDIVAAREIVERTSASPTATIPTPTECIAAAYWPVSPGHFYVECRHEANSDRAFTQLRFGFLLQDPLFDTSHFERFYETIGVDPPLYQSQWPLQMLTVSGSRNGPPIDPIQADAEPETSRLKQLFHGQNPLYGVEYQELTLEDSTESPTPQVPSAVTRELYEPLQRIDSLGYYQTATSLPNETHRLDAITVFNPPGFSAVWVDATADRIRTTQV